MLWLIVALIIVGGIVVLGVASFAVTLTGEAKRGYLDAKAEQDSEQ